MSARRGIVRPAGGGADPGSGIVAQVGSGPVLAEPTDQGDSIAKIAVDFHHHLSTWSSQLRSSSSLNTANSPPSISIFINPILPIW